MMKCVMCGRTGHAYQVDSVCPFKDIPGAVWVLMVFDAIERGELR